MKHLQNNWRSLLVLTLFLGLAIYFRAFLITNIFEPIAMWFWAVWRIVVSMHQNIFWTILLFICSTLLIRFLPFRRNVAGSAYPAEHPSPDRVEDWLRLMKNVSPGTDETEYLHDSLKRLLISIHQVERFRFGKVDEPVMPEAVHCFIYPVKRKQDYRLQMLRFTPKWFRRWVRRVFQIDNISIEETLTWMESLMEINND